LGSLKVEAGQVPPESKGTHSAWKRPLFPVVLALMGGLVAGAWGFKAPGNGLLWVSALFWVFLAGLYLARQSFWFLPLVFFAVLGAGFYHSSLTPRFYSGHVASLPLGEELVLAGRLARTSRVTSEETRLFFRAEAWKGPRGWERLEGLVLLHTAPFTPPPVGTRLVVRGKLREFRDPKNPGAPNRTRQWAAEGVFRRMYLRDPGHLVLLGSRESISLAEHLRGGVRRLLAQMPLYPRAIYLSMLLGDQGEVTPEMRENLARTGTSHILVINGMHLGAVAAVTYFGVFWLLRRFPWLLLRVNALKLATLAAVVPVVGYAHLAGGSPSTQRAEIMVLAYLFLVFLGRPREIWSGLALAALVILVLSPLRLFSVSFQLSFAAVAGILYLVPQWFKTKGTPFAEGNGRVWLARLGRWAREALAVSGAASLATAPLVAHHFQVVSLYGFLVNLAVIPLVLMAALPLGEMAVLAEAAALTPLARLFLTVGEIPVTLGYTLISWVARLPGSGLAVPTPSWTQIILLYSLVLFLFPRHRRWWTWVGTALTVSALIVSISLPLRQPAKACEITVLDSNSGLAGLVVAPSGQRLVVSAAWPTPPGWEGGGPGPLPGYLNWRQFRRLDALVALELNPRNVLELLALVKHFQVGGLWWQGPRPTGMAVTLMNFLGDAGHPAQDLGQMKSPLRLGEVSLEFVRLAPVQKMALKVESAGRQVLILPPLRHGTEGGKGPPLSELEALIAPESLPLELLPQFPAKNLIFYGAREAETLPPTGTLSVFYTRQGLVTLHLAQDGATITQWRP